MNARHEELCSYYAPVLSQLDSLTWQPSGNAAANCPSHSDTTRSLSVKFGRNNELLLKCHGKESCVFDDIAKALDRPQKDFFFQAAGNDRPTERLEETYDYVDEAGKLLFQSMRFFPKRFMQRQPDPERDGGWIMNLNGVRRVPYRLNEIHAAPKDRTVCIFEGERKVHCAESLGLLATCNAGGAEKWLLEWRDIFNDRPVAIFPDHDEKGWKHCAVIAKCLMGAAKPLRLVELPGLRLKEDVLDWRRRYQGQRKTENVVQVRDAVIDAVLSSPLYDPDGDTHVKLAVLRMEMAKALAMSGAT
jgi:putative DNA primase/helicase